MEFTDLEYFVPNLEEAFDNHDNSSTTVKNDIAESLTYSNENQQQQSNSSEECRSCVRMELKVKKCISKVTESYSNTLSNLHAKEKEKQKMEKKIQELLVERQFDQEMMQNCLRRVTEGHRQRQTLESQLNSERSQIKLVQEKALRSKCEDVCKQRKLQLSDECKQLRLELELSDERKESAEQQRQKYAQELLQYGVKFGNRDVNEVLATISSTMQNRNSILEENVLAETRVKLDSISALEKARHQLEIRGNMIRKRDHKLLELKGMLAQLLAVIPPESVCTSPSSSTSDSTLHVNGTSTL